MLLSGSLADLDVAGIAAMTSLGRTSLRLELRASSGDLIGSMVLKAGRVVSATAGEVRGRDALRVILRSASDARFQLAHEPLDFVLSSALASVDELRHLARGTAASAPAPRPASRGCDDGDADTDDDTDDDTDGDDAYREATVPREPRSRPRTAPPAAARIAMMQGPLDEFDLVTLIHTIGVGRQLVEIEVRDRAGMPLGAVRVKSGKLVAAHAGDASGIGAVSALSRAAEGFEFAAYRIVAGARPLDELASVAELGARVAGGAPRDRVVMEGSLADFDLPTLLHTVGCSRQHCALEIGDGRAIRGTICVKSGIVVSANAGPLTGIPAVQHLIGAPPDERFRLIQRACELPDEAPLGPVGHVLLHADAPAPPRSPAPPRAPAPAAAPAPDDRAAPAGGLLVMEGRLADFDVRTVLEVLAATRQHARLQILAPGQAALGEITLKAGWILSSQAGALRGREALAFLLAASPRLEFRVLTAAEAVAGDAPLGQVHEVLVGLPGPRAAGREASTRILRWAIPISFALGGTIVFLVTRGGTTTRPIALDDPPAQHRPPPAAAASAAGPDRSAAPPAARELPVPAPGDASPPDGAGRRIQTAQTALEQLGYAPGPVDGILGRRTRGAILRFQRAQHLRATGALDPETWSAIAAQLMMRRPRS
jgi:hypothetical protein